VTINHSSINCIAIAHEGHAECRHCAIRKNSILADVDVVKHDQLLKEIAQFLYVKKTIIFAEDSLADAIFVVRKGLVKLEETLNDGSTRTVRVVRQGGVVGLEAFLNNGQRYDQSAIALQDAEICRISHQVIKGVITSEPDFYKAVLKQWHLQIEESSRIVVEFSTGSLKQRLACVLLMLINEANRNALVEIEMISIEDMAALTGVTKESVSRVISEFKRCQLLTKSGSHKMLFDEVSLRKIAENNL